MHSPPLDADESSPADSDGRGEQSRSGAFPVQDNIDSRSASTLNGVSVHGSVQREGDVVFYSGEGTPEAPYIVDWEPEDPENPYNWDKASRKWPLTFLVGFNAFDEATSRAD